VNVIYSDSFSSCYNLAMIETILTTIATLVLGWACGALINYLADVLPYRRRLVTPFCLACQLRQPLRNYFLWPRRCGVCDQTRSKRTWVVELLAALITLWLWNAPPPGVGFWGGLVLLIYFGVVIVIDIEYRLILHPVSMAGAVLGLVIGVWLHGFVGALIGGVVGFGLMYAFYYLGAIFGKWMARRRGMEIEEEALGFGDVNLSGVLGLMLGFPGILTGLIFGIVLGGFFSVFYILFTVVTRRYQAMMAIPYGPFLIGGAIIMLFFSNFLLWLVTPP
jgi:prepilin signal peptidase PulO-like enzyme (type II secretory pathway)